VQDDGSTPPVLHKQNITELPLIGHADLMKDLQNTLSGRNAKGQKLNGVNVLEINPKMDKRKRKKKKATVKDELEAQRKKIENSIRKAQKRIASEKADIVALKNKRDEDNKELVLMQERVFNIEHKIDDHLKAILRAGSDHKQYDEWAESMQALIRSIKGKEQEMEDKIHEIDRQLKKAHNDESFALRDLERQKQRKVAIESKIFELQINASQKQFEESKNRCHDVLKLILSAKEKCEKEAKKIASLANASSAQSIPPAYPERRGRLSLLADARILVNGFNELASEFSCISEFVESSMTQKKTVLLLADEKAPRPQVGAPPMRKVPQPRAGTSILAKEIMRRKQLSEETKDHKDDIQDPPSIVDTRFVARNLLHDFVVSRCDIPAVENMDDLTNGDSFIFTKDKLGSDKAALQPTIRKLGHSKLAREWGANSNVFKKNVARLRDNDFREIEDFDTVWNKNDSRADHWFKHEMKRSRTPPPTLELLPPQIARSPRILQRLDSLD
jgi:hypothetical protein